MNNRGTKDIKIVGGDTTSDDFLYIFLDEGGNFDFSKNGTKYFTITSVTITRPWKFDEPLSLLKHKLLETGLDIEYFHASDDRQQTRNKVFNIITDHPSEPIIDSIIVEKSKTNPSLYDQKRFYPKILGYLLSYVISQNNISEYKGLVIVTDSIPVKKHKQAIEKAIKTTISSLMKSHAKPYVVVHHASKSSFCLQVADYCNWAIFRKWSSSDSRSYSLIKKYIKSEFDIFETGGMHYYL